MEVRWFMRCDEAMLECYGIGSFDNKIWRGILKKLLGKCVISWHKPVKMKI